MDTLRLGQIIRTPQERDSIHIAVAPVVAAADLNAGQHVGLNAAGEAEPAGGGIKSLGIVDPYLTRAVERGQTFWLLLYPGSIVGLRHDWFHPAFTRDPSKAQSESWIRHFAQSVGLSYEVLMNGARAWVYSQEKDRWGEYLVLGGLLEGESVPDEFWPHFEAVTGTTVPKDHQESFFSCSC